MLDIKYIRENPTEVIERLAQKGRDAKEEIARILELDTQRRSMISENALSRLNRTRFPSPFPSLRRKVRMLLLFSHR